MKLYAAALALSAAALLVDDTAADYSSSAGQCIKTVTADVEKCTFYNGNYDNVEWTAAANFYANRNGNGNYNANANGNYNYYANNGANAEQQDQQGDRGRCNAYANANANYNYYAYQDVQWAENSIGAQLRDLAEYLNIEFDNEDQEANEANADYNEANYNNYYNQAVADAAAEVQDCQYNQDQFSKYSMPYDAELAEKLGIGDRCSFNQFYELTYNLAENGCQDNNYQDLYDYSYSYNYGQEAQNADQEEQDAVMNEDGIKKIFQNCQNSYKEIGIFLEEDDMEEIMKDDTLKSLFQHMLIDMALSDNKLDAYLTISDGNFADAFENFFQGTELDDDEKINLEVVFAIKNGDFTKYLLETLNLVGYYQAVDWEDVMGGFFYSIGLEDVGIDDLDSYTTSLIYYNVYEVEEYGCEQAMTDQFGKNKAANEGYIEKTNMVDNWLNNWFGNRSNNNNGYSWQFGNGSNGSFDTWLKNWRNGDNGDFNDSWLSTTVTNATPESVQNAMPSSFRTANGNFTPGAAAGIAIGALAAVALVILGAFKLGQAGRSGQASAGRKAPLITDQSNVKTNVYHEHTDPPNETGASPVRRHRTFAAFT